MSFPSAAEKNINDFTLGEFKSLADKFALDIYNHHLCSYIEDDVLFFPTINIYITKKGRCYMESNTKSKTATMIPGAWGHEMTLQLISNRLAHNAKVDWLLAAYECTA